MSSEQDPVVEDQRRLGQAAGARRPGCQRAWAGWSRRRRCPRRRFARVQRRQHLLDEVFAHAGRVFDRDREVFALAYGVQPAGRRSETATHGRRCAGLSDRARLPERGDPGEQPADPVKDSVASSATSSSKPTRTSSSARVSSSTRAARVATSEQKDTVRASFQPSHNGSLRSSVT